MSDQNKAYLRRVNDGIWNQHNLDLFNQEFHPDFRSTGPGVSEVQDLDTFHAQTKLLLTAFPDFHSDFVEMIAEGDSVVAVFRAKGTFKADFGDIPHNNKPVSMFGIVIFRIQDGKIKERIAGYDTFGLLQDMGAASLAFPIA